MSNLQYNDAPEAISKKRYDRMRERATQKEADRQTMAYDNFHETMAVPMSGSYGMVRDEPRRAVLPAHHSATEWLIRTVAVAINIALGIRYVIALFTTDQSHQSVAALFGATSLFVSPLHTLFGQDPINGNGHFDLSALVAIVGVSIIAYILGLVARGARHEK